MAARGVAGHLFRKTLPWTPFKATSILMYQIRCRITTFSSSPGVAGICDVMAATTRSGRTLLDRSGERTKAARCFVALRSVKGKGTRTTSPWLKLVVDGILGVIPEFESRLLCFEPCDIVRLNFQMRRQIVNEPHLVAHIQMLDCLADFRNRAHAGQFPPKFLQ